jgi:hypothetical protein
MSNPALCTEANERSFTVGTFDLYIQAAGGTEQLVGNITTGSFQYTPNVFEHRDGKTNSLDAILALGRDYIINFTTDAITARNIAVLLNEDTANAVDGCRIPLTGARCVRSYGARLVHTFSDCSGATCLLQIEFWRSAILSEFNLNFEAETPAVMTGTIRSLKCSSIHPTEPYGRITFCGTCPAS